MNVDQDHQITGAIIGAAITVHRDLGPGLDEGAYESALARKLQSLGIAHECQVPLRIHECRLLARLRQTGWPFGWLINFNSPTLPIGIRRITL